MAARRQSQSQSQSQSLSLLLSLSSPAASYPCLSLLVIVFSPHQLVSLFLLTHLAANSQIIKLTAAEWEQAAGREEREKERESG